MGFFFERELVADKTIVLVDASSLATCLAPKAVGRGRRSRAPVEAPMPARGPPGASRLTSAPRLVLQTSLDHRSVP